MNANSKRNIFSLALLAAMTWTGCSGPNPEPVVPKIESGSPGSDESQDASQNSPIPTDDSQSGEATGSVRDEGSTAFPLASLRSFRFVAFQSPDEVVSKSKGNDENAPSVLRARLVSCKLVADSPSGKNKRLNKPPKLYVVVGKGEKIVATSLALSGQHVSFPRTSQHEFDVMNDDQAKYAFAVYDSQVGADPQVASTTPCEGSSIARILLANRKNQGGERPRATLTFAGVSLCLEMTGEVCWYRLKNLTIPTDAPSRKPFDEGNDIPELRIRLYRDGVPLESASGATWSTVLAEGWEGTFPNEQQNWWPILERSDARYDMEVQDTDWFDEQVFKVSDLSGESFRVPVSEKVGELVGPERAGKILFELLPNGAVVGQ